MIEELDSTARERPLERIESYWRRLAAVEGLPARRSIDPRGIDGALTHAFILERQGRGAGRFRVAGQHVCAMAGTDVRGKSFRTLAESDATESIERHLERVFEAPMLVRVDYAVAGGTAALLLLPLLDRDGCVSRALGGIASDGAPGGRLLSEREVVRLEKFVPERFVMAPPSAQGFAEAAATFRPDGRPNLRLVKS